MHAYAHQSGSKVDRCRDLLAGLYKHVDGLGGVDPAPLAHRPWFRDGLNLELPTCQVCVAGFTAFLSGAQPQVAVLKEREDEFAEPALVSANQSFYTVFARPWSAPSCRTCCLSMLRRSPPDSF